MSIIPHWHNPFNNVFDTDYDEDLQFPGYCYECNREIWRHYPIRETDIELCGRCEDALELAEDRELEAIAT